MHHSYLDEYSDLASFIHKVEPRIKIITFVLFILFIVLTPPTFFITFGFYGIVIIILIILSKIPFQFIFKRSLVVIPFVLLIAVFIPFFKKGEVIGGYSLGTLKLTITYDGLIVFWNVLVKSYLSTLCMILLISSTKFSEFLKAMERLKCSKIITMILSFMYRYIFVTQEQLMMMKQAKAARSVNGSRWFHIKTLANMVGVLFIRSYERAESVYLAMCARGFDGNIRTINNYQLTKKDFFFFLIVIGILSGIRLLAGCNW